MSGRSAVLVVLAGIVACGSVAHGAAPPSPQVLYTVTSMVMQKPGEAPRACYATPLPYPPIGCGGPDLNGIDLRSIPGVTSYQNGVLATPVLRLVGTWDGRALRLTGAPTPAAMSEVTQAAQCAQKPGATSSPDTPAPMQKVIDDEALLKSHGVMLLEFYMCNENTLFLLVAVADPTTVAFLTKRYGSVQVSGWLQPAG